MIHEFQIVTGITAKSVVRNQAGTYDIAARFGANILPDGNWNSNKSISTDIYSGNKKVVSEDQIKFDEKVGQIAEKFAPIVDELMQELVKELEQELAGQ